MPLTESAKKMLPIILLSLSVIGCSSLSNHSPTFPSNLNLISLSDGGICMDAESAKRLADFKAELESL